ncbi:MAG TPA: hypothetical protein VHB25_00625 [Gemmatimonadaceae bacterium]|nr:hypothetical protein [Gemmatimonadaceae bacterium]
MKTRSLLPTALLLSGCILHHRPPAPEPPRGPARDSLFQFDLTRSDSIVRRGAVDGFLAVLAPDVVFLRAGVPAVYGADAARRLLTASGSTVAATWEPLGGDVSRDRQSGYTFGVAARATASGPVQLERYIAFWRRGAGAAWRIAAYAEIGAPPAAEVTFSSAELTPPPPPAAKAVAGAAFNIREADSLFSDLADRMGTANAFGAYVAPYGVIFGAPTLVVGPSAVRAYFTARSAGTSLAWRPVFQGAAGSLDLGFTVGEYIATGRGASGAAVQRFGKYLTIWQRQPNGDWKFVVDGGNPTPAKSSQ